MCGIVGIYYKTAGRTVQESSLTRMCKSIYHRGPDDEGHYVDGSMGMGMRRLSVIDLQSGKQPLFNEDGSIAVVYNGEIYNYRELRTELESLGHRFTTNSDTEVLVHGYEAWGLQLPERLNGMFAFSLWDSSKKRLVLARDHIGVKPLYLFEDEEKLVWGSEIKAILVVPEVQRELDSQAMFDFFRFGYVPGPRTMFKGIRKIDPATMLVVEGGMVHKHRYWDLKYPAEGSVQRTVGSYCDELRALLQDSIQRQLMSDVPLGAFLSGGLDSSSIVANMSKLGVGHIATYAIGFGAGDEFHCELKKARLVAERFRTDHHEIMVQPDVAGLMEPLIWHLDEPFTDTSFLVTYLVSKLARETVTVILSGMGGDEIFAGYRRYLCSTLQRYVDLIPGATRRGVLQPILSRMPVDRGSSIKDLFRYARRFINQADLSEPQRYQGYVSVYNSSQRSALFVDDFARLESNHASEHVARFYDCANTTSPLNRMLYADLKTSLVDSLLTFTDKMTMAVSLEARVPLLDYRLVEFAATIPPGMKLKGGFGMKHIFKVAMRDQLPKSIIYQKKQGFGTPVSRWLRGSLRPMLEDLLSTKRIEQRGYFREDTVRRLIADHMQQREDNSEHLMALLTFELWHQRFLD